MAGEDDDAVNPGGIPQSGTSKQQLLRVQGQFLLSSAGLHGQSGLIGVQAAVGLLGAQPAPQPAQLGRADHGRSLGQSLLDLEVGLSVEIGRLDIAQTLGLGARHEDKVSREGFFRLDPDDITHSNVNPFRFVKRRPPQDPGL